MKQGIEIGNLILNSQTSEECFKKTELYFNQDLKRFFWLDGVYKIYGLEGEYRLGILFENETLKWIELYAMDFDDEMKIKKEVLHKIIHVYSLGEKSIIYNDNKKSGYKSVLILF